MRIAYQQPPPLLPPQPAPAQQEDTRSVQRTPVGSSPTSISNTIRERMAKYRQVASPDSYEKEQRRLWEEEERSTARAAAVAAASKAEAPKESKHELSRGMSLEERMEALRQNSSRHTFERRLQSRASKPADMPELSPDLLQERGAAFGGLRGSHQSTQSTEEAEVEADVEASEREKPRPADMPNLDPNILQERMGAFAHRSELSANTRDEGGVKGRPGGALNSYLKLVQERMDAFSHRPERLREYDARDMSTRPADMPELDPNLLQERMRIFSHRSGPDAVIEADDALSNRPPPSAKIEEKDGAAAQNMMASDDARASARPNDVQDPLPNLDAMLDAKSIDREPIESNPETSPIDSVAGEVTLEEIPDHDTAVTNSPNDIEEGSRLSVPPGLHVSNADKSIVDPVNPNGITGRSEGALGGGEDSDAVASLADDCEPERMEEGWPCDTNAHRTAITTAILDNAMASDERSSDEDTSAYASDTQLDASLSTWPGCHSLLSKEYSNFLAYLDSPDTDDEGTMSAAHDVELHNTANGVVVVRRICATNPAVASESPQEQAVVFMGASNACSVEITTEAGRDVDQAQSSSESTLPSVRNDTSPGASVKGNGQPSIIPWYYRPHHRWMFVALPLVVVVLLLVVIVLAVTFARK